jgi:hypothetical protein
MALGFGSAKLARKSSVPYIPILEQDLATEIAVACTQTSSIARKTVRAARCALNYTTVAIPDMSGAYALHCNAILCSMLRDGSTRTGLLFLDSRMSKESDHQVMTGSKLDCQNVQAVLYGCSFPDVMNA